MSFLMQGWSSLFCSAIRKAKAMQPFCLWDAAPLSPNRTWLPLRLASWGDHQCKWPQAGIGQLVTQSHVCGRPKGQDEGSVGSVPTAHIRLWRPHVCVCVSGRTKAWGSVEERCLWLPSCKNSCCSWLWAQWVFLYSSRRVMTNPASPQSPRSSAGMTVGLGGLGLKTA